MELISLTPTSCRTISNMRSLTSCLKHSLFATSIVAKILFIAPSGSDILFSRNSFRLAWVMSTSNWLRVMIVPYMSKRHQPHCRGVGSFQGANTITVRPNSCIADLRKSCSTTRSPTCWLTLNASNQIIMSGSTENALPVRPSRPETRVSRRAKLTPSSCRQLDYFAQSNSRNTIAWMLW